MPAKPISFGNLNFSKRGNAVAFLNAILQKYDPGDKVNRDDAQILLHALSHHPEAKQKIGCGILGFSVRSAEFGTKCFWVNRWFNREVFSQSVRLSLKAQPVPVDKGSIR